MNKFLKDQEKRTTAMRKSVSGVVLLPGEAPV